MKRIRVKVIRSRIREQKRTKAVMDSLGLRKIGQEREYVFNDSVMGMVKKVNHLVSFEIIEKKSSGQPAKKPAAAKAPVKAPASASKPAKKPAATGEKTKTAAKKTEKPVKKETTAKKTPAAKKTAPKTAKKATAPSAKKPAATSKTEDGGKK